MIRNLNYTERKKILRSEVTITLIPAEGAPPSFTVEFNLAKHSFAPTSSLVVEAYRGLEQMRFEWGTVEQPVPPDDLILTDVPIGPLFRVKVIASDGSGRLLGLAAPLHATDPAAGGRQSLLPVRYTGDLGETLWKIDYLTPGEPMLVINSQIHAAEERLRDTTELSLVLWPSILREILHRIAFVDRPEHDNDENAWSGWLLFAKSISGDCPDFQAAGEDARLLWVETVVADFSEKIHICRDLNQLWEDRK